MAFDNRDTMDPVMRSALSYHDVDLAPCDLETLELVRLGSRASTWPQRERPERPAFACDGHRQSAGSWPNFAGDYYGEPEDVVRGVCLAAAPPCLGRLEQVFADGDLGGAFWAVEQRSAALDTIKLDRGGTAAMQSQKSADPCGAGFSAADAPPGLPSDLFFKLETTTTYVSSTAPSDIGNRLLRFLRTEVISSVTKVSREKFAIKADVLADAAACTLKARVYSAGRGSYAVEFQRRCGDCQSFRATYQQAAAHLEAHFGAPTAPQAPRAPTAAAPEFRPPVLPRAAGEDGAGLAPLLDLLRSQDPAHRAEALAALAWLARESAQAALAIRTSNAFEELNERTDGQDPSTRFAVGRLLAALAEA